MTSYCTSSRPLNHLALAVALLSPLAACDWHDNDSSEPLGPVLVQTSAPEVRASVMSSVAATLDPAGKFVFAEPRSPHTRPIITRERAVELARSYLRTFGPYLQPAFDQEHGQPVLLSSLEPHDRVLYTNTPYLAVPEDATAPVRKRFGPWFLVPMGSNGKVVLIVGVSAYNTDVTIEDGGIVLPRASGNDFFTMGVPNSAGVPIPISPEAAAAIAAGATGAQVSELPELIRMGARFAPQISRWKIVLNRPVQARGVETGAIRSTSVVFVDPDGRVVIPATRRPSGERMTYRSNPLARRGVAPTYRTIEVGLHPDMNTEVEQVSFDPAR